jgi:hypothetical protein
MTRRTTVLRPLLCTVVALGGLSACGPLAHHAAGVPYRIRLTQPLDRRTLMDGACIPPGTDGLETTSFCSDHGVRLSWHNGKPQPIQVDY